MSKSKKHKKVVGVWQQNKSKEYRQKDSCWNVKVINQKQHEVDKKRTTIPKMEVIKGDVVVGKIKPIKQDSRNDNLLNALLGDKAVGSGKKSKVRKIRIKKGRAAERKKMIQQMAMAHSTIFKSGTMTETYKRMLGFCFDDVDEMLATDIISGQERVNVVGKMMTEAVVHSSVGHKEEATIALATLQKMIAEFVTHIEEKLRSKDGAENGDSNTDDAIDLEMLDDSTGDSIVGAFDIVLNEKEN